MGFGWRSLVGMAKLRGLVVLVLVVAGCSSDTVSDPSVDDDAMNARINTAIARLDTVPETMRGSILSWYNTNGLAQLDPTVWQTRLDRACAAQFWQNPDVLRTLGDEFVASDMALSARSPDAGPVDMPSSYSMLWVMALNHCRDLVPADAVAAGPPTLEPRP